MKNIKYFVCSLFLVFCILLVGNNSINKSSFIESILSKNYYSSLPIEAKEFIKESFYDNGNIILLEENKKDNYPYLNPEFISYLSLSEEEKENVEVIPEIYNVDFESEIQSIDGDLPSSYDSRDVDGKNYVTPLRNQGSSSLCWAFSTAEAAESYVLRQSNTSYDPSKSLLISEKQIDYATTSNVIRNYNKTPYSSISRNLGGGGNFLISTFPLASGTSLFDRDNFVSFDSPDSTKMELSEVLSIYKSEYEMNSSLHSITNSYRESTSSLSTSQANTRKNILDLIKKSIMDYGGAYVGTFWNSSCMVTYKGNTLLDVYNCNYSTSSDGHALEIIGWDDDYEYEYCITSGYHYTGSCGSNQKVSGKGVWILRNSWGNSNPYPYLTYDSINSSISVITNLTKTSDRNWDNTYSIGNGTHYNSSYTMNMSDTDIYNTEIIKKVKFLAYSANSSYTIKVLKTDGTYEEINYTNDYPGLVTIDIPNNSKVNSSSKITISSSNGELIDKFLIFTENENSDPYVDLPSLGQSYTSGTKILYSRTRNIPSGCYLEYKLIGSSGNDESDYLDITNNVIAVNNVNTYFKINTGLPGDHYKLIVSYNGIESGMQEFNYFNMQGSGTSTNPYIIHNPFEFDYINNAKNSYYKLNNDLDFSLSTSEGGYYYNNGYGYKGINEFSGSLDGNGYAVKGLYQNNYIDKDNIRSNSNGLFYSIHGNATIKNLTFEDYEITCSSGYCGSLFSVYIGSGGSNNTVTLSNVALKNGKLMALDESNETYVGGLYGTINDLNGSANINGIYIDSYVENISGGGSGYFAYNISAGSNNPNINISNIELLGIVKSLDKSLFNTFDYKTKENQNINISNVISTMNYDSLGQFTSSGTNSNITFNNLNIVKNNNVDYLDNIEINDSINVIEAKDISNFTNEELYSSWNDFSTYWDIKTIDDINRIPNLNFVEFDYNTFSDIVIDADDEINLYSFISSNNAAVKRVEFSGYDDDIIEIDDEGNIIPLNSGISKLNIRSLYDGYDNEITICVNGNIIITFVSNNENNNSKTQSVIYNKSTRLDTNEFEYTGYVFSKWNTKSDGSGESYNDEEEITFIEDITLYAIWDDDYVNITFVSNNENNNSKTQSVIYNKSTKLNKNEFDYTGYVFSKWNTKSDGSGESYNDEDEITLTDDIILYVIWDELYSYIINDINYDDENSIIYDLKPNTLFNDLFSHITLNKNYSLLKESKLDVVATGDKLKILSNDDLFKEYSLIVLGDINSDGNVNSMDYVKIRKHIMGTSLIKDLVFFKAADVNKDDMITSIDYVRIRKYIMNGGGL